MTGERNLQTLLQQLTPKLQAQSFTFCQSPSPSTELLNAAWAIIKEDKSTTLILPVDQALANQLDFDGQYRCITLQVHSSLEAVGLTAAVSQALADRGISANVIAAYYHDHIFVPEARAREALACLQQLSIDQENK